MRVKVNKEACIGCELCVSMCPKVFKLGEDGKSELIEQADFDKNSDCIDQAQASCPVAAIVAEK
ncbi:ferredoxin [Patescibacteria group bacterium]|nr:ferredoxin [Patescibacteria group bacterium]MBU1921669.1 ferredoxin [Patescibacteria group bacterium]